jgi:uncharacterized membrane protein YhiD involved in acid resistance
MDMLQDYLNRAASDIGQAVVNMAVALFCGFLISLLYRRNHRGPGYSATFVGSIAPLAMITALVIMVIGNNLARAFGLVGALSVIRFRTAIKDPQDIVFIFFALAVGMAAGVGLHLSAIVGTVFIGLGIFVLSRTGFAVSERREFLLRFALASTGKAVPYEPLLDRYCERHRPVRLKSVKKGALLELSFYVQLKDRSEGAQLVRELEQVPGVSRVNLFSDEGPF